jgi:GntR family transcriptional regulator
VIDFQLDDRSGLATYLQLAQQVRDSLRLGLLRPGDRLPTAKEVVAKLAINPNTVLKAYRELEREGLVGARPGAGTFVLRTLARTDPAERAELAEELRTWIAKARAAGLEDEDIEALYRTALRGPQGSQGPHHDTVDTAGPAGTAPVPSRTTEPSPADPSPPIPDPAAASQPEPEKAR